MSLLFTDIPRFVSPEIYQQAIDRMVGRLETFPGVVSIYQVGGISTPGISDIDLFVVFDDKGKVRGSPLENLSGADQYLFTHNLFGTSESLANEMEQYTFFGKFKLLAGEEQNFNHSHLSETDEKILKTQIGLEYLVKAMITSSIEHTYHTIKLRNLFLHAKALLIDLSFLGVEAGKLVETIREITQVRKDWFHHALSHKNLNYLAQQYHACLTEELPELLRVRNFYVPAGSNLRISRNIKLKQSGQFSVTREGIFFPKALMKVHHKVPKLLNKMNEFTFHLPFLRDSIPDIVMKRHQFICKMVDYQKSHLPNFIPTAFGLNIFSGESV